MPDSIEYALITAAMSGNFESNEAMYPYIPSNPVASSVWSIYMFPDTSSRSSELITPALSAATAADARKSNLKSNVSVGYCTRRKREKYTGEETQA